MAWGLTNNRWSFGPLSPALHDLYNTDDEGMGQAFGEFAQGIAGGENNYAAWINTQRKRLQQQFTSEMMRRPDPQNAYWTTFLEGIGPDYLRDLYMGLSSRQRGANPQNYSPSRITW